MAGQSDAWFDDMLYPLQDAVLARALASVTTDDWERVRWRPPAPSAETFVMELRALAEELLLG